MNPIVEHLRISCGIVWEPVPDKTHKVLDAKERFRFLLQSLSYGNISDMLEEKQTVDTTGHCLVREDVFTMKQ